MHLDLAVWLNLISTLAIVGALIFTAVQVRQGNIKRRDLAAITLIQTTQSEGWTRTLDLVRRLPENATPDDVERMGKETLRAMIDFGVRLETVGYMVFRRTIDLQTVDDLVGGVTLMYWSRAKGWFQRDREQTGNPKSFEWCEWLARQIEDRRRRLGHQPAYLRYTEWLE